MRKIVIIGGGVAGLSALNRLADLGIAATLIEGGDYPSHKICGEFFSPESVPILKAWGLDSFAEINRISLNAGNSSLSFSLSRPALSCSRFNFDFHLFKRAKEKGALILTKTRAVKIDRNKILLDSGEVLEYTDLIVSAGRLFGAATPEYFGIKNHLKGIAIQDRLEMFPFPGGYAGLSPVEGGAANFACLIRKKIHTMPTVLQSVFRAAPRLKERLDQAVSLFNEEMVCPVPSFGIKKRLPSAGVYCIGDAAGTIPPAAGLGLSLALDSGYMVADYVLKGDDAGFQKAWEKKYKRVFLYGQCLHRVFMNPAFFLPGIQAGQLFSTMAPRLFNMTRIR